MKLSDLASGVVVGSKYRLLEIIGQGGYGDVWRAERLEDGQAVAIKFYRDDERGKKFLIREADLAKQFDHENLVQVFSASSVEGLFCMEMEYVEGVTLSRRLLSHSNFPPPTLTDVISWMEQIAEALQYLHNRPHAISHGDIKLDNLIVTPEGKIKVTDFGQSRMDEGDKFAPTDLGGTWLYMAPESLGLEREVAHCESDIYSFGVTIYRILTGRFPRQTAAEVYTMTPFPRPCELNSAVPASIDEIICKCLEKKPGKRFQNGGRLLETIRMARANLSGTTAARIPTTEIEPLKKSGSPYDLIEEAHALVQAGRLEEALASLSEALQRVSTKPSLLAFYASLNQKVGRIKIARATYERIAGWMERQGIPFSERKHALEQLGNLQIDEKDYEDAVLTFALLHENFPEDLWVKFKYGVALGLAARLRHSIRLLEEVRKERPTSATLCAKIGFAYLQLKDTKQAIQYFNEALMFDEFEPTALYHMAILRWLDGRQDRAERYYQRLKNIEGEETRANDLKNKLGL